MEIFPIIMSGGSGTRLWPMSRRARPKQYLPLLGKESLFQATLRRCASAPSHLQVRAPSIIAAADSLDLIKREIEEVALPVDKIILEPIARNTAVVTAVAAACVQALNPEGLVLVLPADHFVGDVDGFWRTIVAGAECAQRGHIVTLGIAPSQPETGYGYIQRGEAIGEQCYQVERFTEKPSLETANAYLENQNYFWNAGIFLFSTKVMQQELGKHAPDIATAGHAAYAKAVRDGDVIVLDRSALMDCPAISIDYAVMEKTDLAAVVSPVNIGWDDVGSWSAIERLAPEMGRHANIIEIGCDNNFILSNGRTIAAIGLEGHVIVETDDAVLIVAKDRIQDVSGLVRRLKEDGRVDLL